MNAFSFGSYYPGESPLHRLDPRAKLLLGCAFIVVALCARNVAALGAVAVFVAAFYLASRIPLGYAARSLAPLLFIVVVASLLNLFVNQEGAVLVEWAFVRITAGGVGACLFIAARLVLILLGMRLITMTTPTLDLTEALEKLLSPFARFGLPAHELGMIMGIALRFLPQFATELVTVYHAQISRGAGLDGSPVRGMRMLSSLLIPLFTSAFRHAETLSAAMDARCYHGGEGRTRLHPLKLSARDGVAAGVLAVLAVCVGLADALL